MPASPASPPPAEENSSSRPLLILLIMVCMVMIATYAARLDDRDGVQAAIVEQQALNEQAHVRTAVLQKELLNVTRPSHIDEIARGNLGLGREGDIIIVPVSAADLAPAAGVTPTSPPSPSWPIWRQWLNLFDFRR